MAHLNQVNLWFTKYKDQAEKPASYNKNKFYLCFVSRTGALQIILKQDLK